MSLAPIFFPNSGEFHQWLEENYKKEKEVLVGYYKSRDRETEHELVGIG